MENLFSVISNLNLNSYKIEISFKENVKFDNFHGRKLYDLMCKACAENDYKLGDDKIVDVLENRRNEFTPGEKYTFGFIKINPQTNYISFLQNKLHALGKYNRKNDSLWGCYDLLNISENRILYPDLGCNSKNLILEFISPARIIRADKNRRTGHRHCDKSFFDLNNFMKLLFNRLYQLSGIEYSLNEYKVSAFVYKNNLKWVDVNYSNKTLGGVSGCISIKGNFTIEDHLLLWAGEILHAGNNTSHGFGKYKLNYI